MLGGGIDIVGITEIAGEAGVGKTQLALQLMLQAQLPPLNGGLGGGAVYLHTDTTNSDPAMKRLHTMAQAFVPKHAAIGADVEMLKQRVFTMQIDALGDLWDVVNERLPAFLLSSPIRLVVLDSVGGLYRAGADDSTSAHWERAQHAMKVAARLKQLSSHFNVAVVVTNQVSDKPLDATRRRSAAPWELGVCGTPSGDSARVPALGSAWASCVNTRIMLTRKELAAGACIGGCGGGEHAATAAAAVGHAHCCHGMPSAVAWDAQMPGCGCGSGGPRASSALTSSWRRWMHVAWSPRMAEDGMAFEVREEGLVAG